MTANASNIEARTNLIWLMAENTENQKSRNAINKKIVGNKIGRTCQNHRQAILVFLTTVTIDAIDAKIRRSIGKRILSNYAQG